MGIKVTNKAFMSNAIVLAFTDFKEEHPNICYSAEQGVKIKGYSDPLSAACVTLATVYINNIVENFHHRLLYYFYLKLKVFYEDLPKGVIYKLAEDFCFPFLSNNTNGMKWPNEIDLIRKDKVDKLISLCETLKPKFLVQFTTVNLSAHPTLFLPILGYIITEIESIKENTPDSIAQPRSFALSPSPGLHWRHILINSKSLAVITSVKAGDSYYDNLKQFYQVFDFNKLVFQSLDDLTDNNNRVSFTCCVQSDGFGICFIFARKKLSGNTIDQNENIFDLEDFRTEEVNNHFLPITVDPGRRQIFTGAVQHSPTEVEVRRCSAKERSCYVGTNRRSKHLKKLKVIHGIKTIETNLPSPKTVSSERFKTYITYLLENIEPLFNFYNFKSAKFIFFAYQERQRANSEMANILLSGGKKYNKTKRKKTKKNRKWRKKLAKLKEDSRREDNSKTIVKKKKKERTVAFKFSDKVPLIVFGDGMKNKDTAKIKGHTPGVTTILTKELQRRQSVFKNAIVEIHEFRTSKVCSYCHDFPLENFKFSPEQISHCILRCKICNILWDRDINASLNMMNISFSVWNDHGRPEVFCRKESQ